MLNPDATPMPTRAGLGARGPVPAVGAPHWLRSSGASRGTGVGSRDPRPARTPMITG